MTMHFPILTIVIPLISAPIIALIKHKDIAWLIALITTALSFIISVALLQMVATSTYISYDLGGWEPPWGIEYKIDLFNGFMLCLISGIGMICTLYAKESIKHEIEEHNQSLFYTMFLLVISSLMGIAATGDLFNAFVFLEVSSLSTYTLVALGSHKKALLASYQYLIIGTVGATFYLIGVGLLYQMTGTLNIADLAERVRPIETTLPIIAAFGFITIGLLLKIAIFPLHQWLPNVYTYAPMVVTALLSATATKVSIYLLIRIILSLFGSKYTFDVISFNLILGILGFIGIFTCSLVAIFQTNLKRLLAYSSVAQIGYIIVGLSFVSNTGLTAGFVHLMNHAVIKCALFLGIGIIFYRFSSVDQKALHGLGKRMPWLAFAIVIGGLSLIGVPLTAGFVSKWYLIQAALENNTWYFAVAILLSSLITVIYVWRIIEVMYFEPKDQENIIDSQKAIPLTMWLPMLVLTSLCILLGVFTDFTLEIAKSATLSLPSIWY